MKTLETEYVARCAAALRAHLAGAGESSLHEAYELGRDALAVGFGVLDGCGNRTILRRWTVCEYLAAAICSGIDTYRCGAEAVPVFETSICAT